MKEKKVYACERCNKEFSTAEECAEHEKHCTAFVLVENAVDIRLTESRDFPGDFKIETCLSDTGLDTLGKIFDYTSAISGFTGIELHVYTRKEAVKETVRKLVSEANKYLTKRATLIEQYKRNLNHTYKKWWQQYGLQGD